MKSLRQHVVRGRLAGSLVGLAGVLFAVPTLFFATHVVRDNPTGSAEPDLPPFQQSFWSWGRAADTTPGVAGPIDVSSSVGLLLLVVALAAGLVGALAYAFRPGADGRILGAAGLAWAASQVVGGLGRRLGDELSRIFSEGDQLVVETLPAGVLEVLSAALLVVSLALVVLRPVVALARAGTARAQALAHRDAAADKAGDEVSGSGERPAPRVGIATIRDVPGGRDVRAVARHEHAGTGVGFSDDPTGDPDRFRPPP